MRTAITNHPHSFQANAAIVLLATSSGFSVGSLQFLTLKVFPIVDRCLSSLYTPSLPFCVSLTGNTDLIGKIRKGLLQLSEKKVGADRMQQRQSNSFSILL